MLRFLALVLALLVAIAVFLPKAAARLAPVAGAAPTGTSFLQLPEGRLAYDDVGHGPLVLLVPGIGDLRAEYRLLTPPLVAAGYRVVSMDLRGQGDSSAGWPEYSSTAVGSDIVALLRHLDAGPAVVAGASMAAGSAAWAAAEAPDLVGGLVLISAVTRDIPPSSPFQATFQNIQVNTLLTRPWGAAAWSVYYNSLYPTAKPADLAGYRARLQANLNEQGRLEAVKGYLDGKNAAVEAKLSAVHTPTLVVMGTKDPEFSNGPAAEGDLVAQRLGGTLLMVEDAGHYPHVEMPNDVAPAVVAFLHAHRS